MPWFAHAARLTNLIEIGRRGEIRGSVLPGLKVTMRFYFKVGLVVVTSNCGITAEYGVDKSVNTSAAHVCAFWETKSLCKNAKCDAYALFCDTNSHNRRAEDRPWVGFFLKEFLPTPTTLDQTPSDYNYAGLVVAAVFKISSKYVVITRLHARGRTLGLPKLLKCINKAQPEWNRSRSHLQSEWNRSRSHFIKKHSSGADILGCQAEARGSWAQFGGGHNMPCPPRFFLFRFYFWRGFKNKSYVCHVLCEELFMSDGRLHIAKFMLKQSLVWYH